MTALYIGLMSGTSLDGVDGVLTALGDDGLQVLAHRHQGFETALAADLLALNRSGADELHRAALAANSLAMACAGVVGELCAEAGVNAHQVRAIGAHGQTVRHRPGQFDGIGYTLQINNPALLAELTGIDVVADLRSRDLAAGGQAAPLVPAFHRMLFARPGRTTAVLNLGGMSNLTVLAANSHTLGFDCGPGNALLDHWVAQHRGLPFDDGGRWAASGKIVDALLALLCADPFFALPPPKSTGRDHFHSGWLSDALARLPSPPAAVDVQATLTELTARVCADAVLRHAPDTSELLVCGGGARNVHLMDRLAAMLQRPVLATDERGLPAEQVEACAFAWLARCCIERRPGNLPTVTGARGPRILGAIYAGR